METATDRTREWYIQRLKAEYDDHSATAAYLYPDISDMLDDIESTASWSPWQRQQVNALIAQIRATAI